MVSGPGASWRGPRRRAIEEGGFKGKIRDDASPSRVPKAKFFRVQERDRPVSIRYGKKMIETRRGDEQSGRASTDNKNTMT
jgi:hypothetical protein